MRHSRRVSVDLAPWLALGPARPAPCHHRAALTAAATLLIIVALVPKQAPRWILYLCVAIFGGTIVPTYSVVMAHVNDAVGEGEFVAASGGLLIVQGGWRGG
jgi:hypothetical protein